MKNWGKGKERKQKLVFLEVVKTYYYRIKSERKRCLRLILLFVVEEARGGVLCLCQGTLSRGKRRSLDSDSLTTSAS